MAAYRDEDRVHEEGCSSDRHVLHVDGGGSCMSLHICQNSLNCTLNICEFYYLQTLPQVKIQRRTSIHCFQMETYLPPPPLPPPTSNALRHCLLSIPAAVVPVIHSLLCCHAKESATCYCTFNPLLPFNAPCASHLPGRWGANKIKSLFVLPVLLSNNHWAFTAHQGRNVLIKFQVFPQQLC